MPVRCAEKQAPAQYIRYTPQQQGVAYNSGAKQRVIHMVEVQKDPMEPPRFRWVNDSDDVALVEWKCFILKTMIHIIYYASDYQFAEIITLITFDEYAFLNE